MARGPDVCQESGERSNNSIGIWTADAQERQVRNVTISGNFLDMRYTSKPGVYVDGGGHQGPGSNVAVSNQRFTGKPIAACLRDSVVDTSGALAQPGAAADAVDRRLFSPARLILFR